MTAVAASSVGLPAARGPASARAPMVLHVRVVTGNGGGPEKTILNSPRFLQRLGYRSKLAYLHPPGDVGIEGLQRRGAALEAEVVSIPDRGPFDLKVVRDLVRLCRRERVDVWHGHDYKSNVLGLAVSRFWPCKLVTTLHGWTNLSGRMPLYVRADRWSLKYYRALICVSADLREECLRAGIPRARCHLVHNAIDGDDYRRGVSAAAAKRALGAPEQDLLLGAVGRLSDEKGFDSLIRATVDLRRAGRPVRLWIAGEGPARADLERLVAELACGDFVRLLGHVADPRPLYEAMDAYVLSSIREGLPNVVLEAMAMQVPVVATRVAGVPTLVEDGASGLIVEPGDRAALTRGIERLVDSPELRDRLARAGRQRVETDFSFARRMEKVVQIYERVLGRSHA